MKKLFFGTILLAWLIVFPIISMAQVNVQINIPIPLPPPIPFIGPPNVVVLPGTNIYAVPGVSEELFFRQGWWWRQWRGNWYRSKYHDHGWAYYRYYPSWHRKIPAKWRDNYRNHTWGGHSWNPPHVTHSNLNNHWRGGRWRTDHGWGRPGGGKGGRTLKGGGRNKPTLKRGRNKPTLKGGGKGERTHPDERIKSSGGGSHRDDRRYR